MISSKDDPIDNGTRKFQEFKAFISGAIGGVTMVLISHPWDLIKTRMQAGSSNFSSDGNVKINAKVPTFNYGSTSDAIRQILRTDGPRGLFKGMSPVLVGTPPVMSLCFGSYYIGLSFCDKYINKVNDSENKGNVVDRLSWNQIGLAGAFSSLPTALILGPAERIKVVLQVDSVEAMKRESGNIPKNEGGLRKSLDLIWKNGGVPSLFRGTWMTLLRDAPGSYFYFITYEYLMKKYRDKNGHVSPGTVIFAGGMSGVVHWVLALPFDIVKTRLQRAGNHQKAMDIVNDVYKEGGVRAFFKGLGPTVIRSFPASAAFFAGVHYSSNLMDYYI